jgi:mono/diheme cytochrome c family protein
MKKDYLIAGLFLLLSACTATNKFEPDAKTVSVMQQKVPGITIENLQEGLVIYKRNCASCHQLYAPSAFTRDKWDRSLKEMLPRAKITDQNVQKKIRDYLFVMAK